MIAAWMLYCIVISTLLGIAALLIERGLLFGKLPVRWVWVVAIVASLVAAPVGWTLGKRAAEAPEVAASDRSGLTVQPRERGSGSLDWMEFSETDEVVSRVGAPNAAGTSSSPESRGGTSSVVASEPPPPTVATPSIESSSAARIARVTPSFLTTLASTPVARTLDRPLLWAWFLGSAFLLVHLIGSHLTLRRARRSWHREVVNGTEVLVSTDTGPAVVGLFRGEIVVPEWALRTPGDAPRLILMHEEEHLRKGDHRLLPLALIGILFLPWNLPLWWLLRRLRHAVELDCDSRLLRRGARVREYGDLLLAVAGRNTVGLLSGAALAEPSSYFARRMRILLEKRRSGWGARFGAFSLAAFIPLGGALMLSPPVVGESEEIAAIEGTTSSAAAAIFPGSEETLSEVPPLQIDKDPLDLAQEGDRTIRRDSAGVTIVETLELPPTSAPQGWVVGPDPILSIGGTEEGPYRFVAIGLAARMGDGGLAVFESASGELRFFDSAGTFLRVPERTEDPTDAGLNGPTSALPPRPFLPGHYFELRHCEGGDIYALNRMTGWMEVWAQDGTLQDVFGFVEPGSGIPEPRPLTVPEFGTVRLSMPNMRIGSTPYRSACSSSGDFLMVGWGNARLAVGRTGLWDHRAEIWLVKRNVGPTTSLGEHLVGDRVGFSNPPGYGNGPHPIGRQVRVAIGEDRAYIGSSDRFDVLVYDLDGELQQVFRGPEEDLSIDSELVRLVRETTADPQMARDIQRIEEAGYPLPASLPAYTELLLDPEGYLWARRFRYPLETSERWGIFSPEGAFLGHMTLPEGFALHEIGGDYLLGTEAGEEGTMQIRMYSLRRG